MGNFPYNHHKYDGPWGDEPANGCPLIYTEALMLAHTLRWWHGEIANTDDWSQSSDAAYEDEVNIAHGLMELFADPGAVRRLAMTGEIVRKRVKLLLGPGQCLFPRIREVAVALFNTQRKEE